MIKSLSKKFFATVALGAVATGVSLTSLSGCNGVEVPIEVTIPLVQNSSITAANEADGIVDIPVGAFCDLFSPEQLDALIRQFGGDLVANLVEITKVQLESVTVTATNGNFDSFTTSDLSIVFLGQPALPLGEAADGSGLGSEFVLSQEVPVDLLNDLEDGDCGAPTLHFEGEQPESNITFNTSATVKVFAKLTLQP